MGKTPGPAPVYLLAGGPGSRRTGGDPLLARVLAGAGVPHPSIAYVGAASGDNRPFLLMLSTYLRYCGAGQVTLAPLVGKRVKLENTRAILESADIVLMSGGDVEAGIQVLEERKILAFLHELYRAGKPFFGISAGSIMLARQWVRWEDPDDDRTASLFPCMGLAPVLCDTHGEEEWEELKALLQLAPEGMIGYGIPSGAALCVYVEGRVEALGAPVYCYTHKGGEIVRCSDLQPGD